MNLRAAGWIAAILLVGAYLASSVSRDSAPLLRSPYLDSAAYGAHFWWDWIGYTRGTGGGTLLYSTYLGNQALPILMAERFPVLGPLAYSVILMAALAGTLALIPIAWLLRRDDRWKIASACALATYCLLAAFVAARLPGHPNATSVAIYFPWVPLVVGLVVHAAREGAELP
jgi:hypothetical protein